MRKLDNNIGGGGDKIDLEYEESSQRGMLEI
jgi:hypothetical protein